MAPVLSSSTRRRLFAGAATLTGSAALAACGNTSSSTEADSKLALSKSSVTVVPFLSGITDAMRPDWDAQIVTLYKQRRPNVTIDLVPQLGPTVDRVQKMTALMAAGSPLDLGDGPLGIRAGIAQDLI